MFKNKIKMLNISELALKLGLINLKNKVNKNASK